MANENKLATVCAPALQPAISAAAGGCGWMAMINKR